MWIPENSNSLNMRLRCDVGKGAQSARLPPAACRRGDHRDRPGDVRRDRLRQRDQLINPNLVDYVLPSLGDMPPVIDPICVEVPDRTALSARKGIGERAR